MRRMHLGLVGAITLLTAACQAFTTASKGVQTSVPTPTRAADAIAPTCQKATPNFLVVAGGGRREMNEISLEKNVLFFQRTLKVLGFNPAIATIFFANGNDGQATVRYVDARGIDRYKVPQIPNLKGAATLRNVETWLRQQGTKKTTSPNFFYFTGHGFHYEENYENNFFALWGDQEFTVRRYTALLDQLPTQTPVVTVMAQCYSGGFANLIYRGGNPRNVVASHNRCGFFATVKTRPSVGCTPEVDEADYVDYSSSFFSGLSGRKRTGEPITRPDYNQDGQVSYAEAHAFAKIDSETIDVPISTSESWLQQQVSPQQREQIWGQPIQGLLKTASPERSQVVTRLAKRLRLDLARSWATVKQMRQVVDSEIEEALYLRLEQEILVIGAEQAIRKSNQADRLTILNRLQKCESASLEASSTAASSNVKK